MGSGASHESATAAVAAGVSEEEVAAHLASLDKKPCTVYCSPFSNNSMGAAMTATACGCAELKLVDLAGEQKSDAYLQINPYGQARDPCPSPFTPSSSRVDGRSCTHRSQASPTTATD